jgi:hypothetical protein
MPMNRIRFQPGLSLRAFLARYGSEAQCEAALEKVGWPEGFRCPRCGGAGHCMLRGRARQTFQCLGCQRQADRGHPPALRFLAIYLVGQAKSGLSSLALMRQLGVSYPTAWLIQHKLLQAMADLDPGCVVSSDGVAEANARLVAAQNKMALGPVPGEAARCVDRRHAPCVTVWSC